MLHRLCKETIQDICGSFKVQGSGFRFSSLGFQSDARVFRALEVFRVNRAHTAAIVEEEEEEEENEEEEEEEEEVLLLTTVCSARAARPSVGHHPTGFAQAALALLLQDLVETAMVRNAAAWRSRGI